MGVEFRWCVVGLNPRRGPGESPGGAPWVEYRVWGWGVDRGWITVRRVARRDGIEHGEYPGGLHFYWRRRSFGG